MERLYHLNDEKVRNTGVCLTIVTKLLGKKTRRISYKYAVQFCVSPQNHAACAKYKLFSSGRIPLIHLFPDDYEVHPLELQVKHKFHPLPRIKDGVRHCRSFLFGFIRISFKERRDMETQHIEKVFI
jgi:hypothetical protein